MTTENRIMSPSSETTVSEDELHALLDGRLDEAAHARLWERVQRDPRAHATLQAWQQQRTALQQMHQTILQDAIPERMRVTALRIERRYEQLRRWERWGGMAASVALAFGLGWFAHGQFKSTERMQISTLVDRTFIQQAVLAHAVYTPEVRHPVEVDATQEDHLVQWLSKRLGRAIKAPRLTDQGFELVGGRLLPGDNGARALLMYQNPQGQRVTLYLGQTPTTIDASSQATEFRYSAEGSVSSFYWVDAGYAYALSGPVDRPTLLQLAQQVHQQL